jgi:hypothetical protein
MAVAAKGLPFELRSQHCLFYGQRQSDRAERSFGIEIILPGFIDDPEQTVFLGGSIAKGDVDLPLLERSRVPSLSMQTTSCFACAMGSDFKVGA